MTHKNMNPLSPKPLLVLGHRGGIFDGGPFYQNSLNVFQEALTYADGFETDACVDKDGEVFLIHEAKYYDTKKGVEYCACEHLDGESAIRVGDARIDELSTAEIKALRLKDGSPLPTLREVLSLLKGRPDKLIDIELKAYEVVEPVLKILQEGLARKVFSTSSIILSSFNHGSLGVVRKQVPEIKIGAIFMDDEQPSTPLFPWWPGSEGRYTSLSLEALQEPNLIALQPDYIIMPEPFLSEKTHRWVRTAFPEAEIMAWVFTEKGGAQTERLLERLQKFHRQEMIAGIMVDRPRDFVASLKKNNGG